MTYAGTPAVLAAAYWSLASDEFVRCGFCKQHDSKPAGFARVTQLATGSVQGGLALHFPSGMRLSGITADNLDVAVAILRQL